MPWKVTLVGEKDDLARLAEFYMDSEVSISSVDGRHEMLLDSSDNQMEPGEASRRARGQIGNASSWMGTSRQIRPATKCANPGKQNFND